MTEQELISQPRIEDISARLRALRRERHLTLKDVERATSGAIGSVVLGTYERNSRTISMKKIIELATFYNVPLTELISGTKSATFSQEKRGATIDLRRTLLRAQSCFDPNSPIVILGNYLRALAQLRGDWNGQIITIRNSDLVVISILVTLENISIRDWLISEKLLLK
jgi:transcriptional regulator with XRE-family HTH domain